MESVVEFLYDHWIPVWNGILGVVEPHLPEHLHWNELCWTFVFYLNEVRLLIHHKTRGLENWEIVANTITYCFFAFLLFEVLRRVIPFVFFNTDGFFNVSKLYCQKVIRNLPIIKNKIQEEVDKETNNMEETMYDLQDQQYIKKLPKNGMTPDMVKDEIARYKSLGSIAWDEGSCSGIIYAADKELDSLMTDVYSEFTWSNPLHPDVFPGVRKMEAEVVRMVANMYNGDKESCGLMTSGGTESVMMACLSYRNIAYERGIKRPEIVAPVSVHPAFDKAAHYFGMKLQHVSVDAEGRADMRAMKRAINKNTIMLVGSAPSYPHGCIDPMEELSKLAVRYGLYLHADCCLGGFLIPFMQKAGFSIVDFDFKLPGVTSVSVDTHKYGYSPKGSSVLLYRNKNIRKYQYFSQPDWTGGIYASASMPGSRSGNVVATTWAALVYHGEKGYVDRTRKVIDTTRYITAALEKIPGIKILSPVDVSVIAFNSDVYNIYSLMEEMSKKKWLLSSLQFPSGIHIAVTMQHTKPGVADRFIKDIRDIANQLAKTPTGGAESGAAALYGRSQQISDRSIVTEIVVGFLDTYYSSQAGEKITS